MGKHFSFQISRMGGKRFVDMHSRWPSRLLSQGHNLMAIFSYPHYHAPPSKVRSLKIFPCVCISQGVVENLPKKSENSKKFRMRRDISQKTLIYISTLPPSFSPVHRHYHRFISIGRPTLPASFPPVHRHYHLHFHR